MIRPWAYLAPNDRELFRTITAFLNKRLAEQGTIDWALKLKADRRVERFAVQDLLANPSACNLAEPWASAWRLIDESWAERPSDGQTETAVYDIRNRLRAKDQSGLVVTTIVDLVKPCLKVEPISNWRLKYIKNSRKPKTVGDILSASLTSGNLIDLSALGLANINNVIFLKSLATALEYAVDHGLDTARRLGWDGQRRQWQIGQLGRVYYVSEAANGHEGRDPDAYHHGIAPSVKLLHAVVTRISELDLIAAQSFTRRWKLNNSLVHVRLWAALSRSEQITPTDEVATFLMDLNQERFWDVHGFPEIAELRTVRFHDMNLELQDVIVDRIQKGPPRNHWPRKVDATKLRNLRLFWSLRELRRIEVGGGVLPIRAKNWLNVRSAQFPELAEMTIDDGFFEGVTVTRRVAKPDTRFDTISGPERLKALEAALATGRRGWDDDPAERANDWINQQGNAEKVLADFETTNNGGDDFPKVWNRFGWAHKPRQEDGCIEKETNLVGEAGRVLGLLNQLSNATLLSAVEGICAWLDNWEHQAAQLPLALPIWLRLWPIAVEVTNGQPEDIEDEHLSVTARVQNDHNEPMDLDTLNSPVGKLVGMFLVVCPNFSSKTQPFSLGAMERQMRDIVIAAEGRSGLIAKHRMIEALPYFLRADPDWVRQNLITPLLADDGAALALWRAVARRTHFTDVLKSIGSAMAERANDRRLGRETRRGLVFSLVIESLYAFRDGRAPAVPNQRIQQMIRTLDDEVRASAANAIQRFIHELSEKSDNNKSENSKEDLDTAVAGDLFRSSAGPFLSEVWPQERSLATPGVSSALADLPATSGDAFVDAVESIARFLVPFECWSMAHYGLYGEEGEAKKLEIINDEAKAQAFLKLLDLTVGTSEGAVIPYDLTDALDQILRADPTLSTKSSFRRLATAARR